ncbi:hypothetical protein [Blautia hansenii]|uniref:hypothetical protein n=1 Tax=Blautia hansenii TaxID=1322 RepID=UPI0022DF1453|nr:hypothetical protein [Blautia hansenii]
MSQTPEKAIWTPEYEIYIPSNETVITQRKLEGLKKLAEIKQWGIRNPTKFMKEFIGVELLDSQEYVFMNSWNKPFCLWLESRGAGKSTMLALYFMTKGLLFNNYWAYICSGNADQAQETFRKIEDIAKKNIESMTGLTDVFINELVKSQANTDGFVRSPMGFTYKLYNGSFVKTLNSNIDGKRGKRANAVCFDEGSWLSEEIFNVIGAFTAVNKEFKLGGDIDVNAIPREIPNQLLYASSASSVDTAFYNKYRDFSKKMLLGDDRYFVADINCDIVIHATQKGIPLNKSLLSQETVDNEMRNNPEKALREYYNRFTKDGGVNQIIKRSLIVRNSEKYVPVMYNDTGKRKFVLCYDPARNIDNSTVLISEILDTDEGYKLKIVNSVNFTDLNIKKKKKPMRTPDQIAALKELIVNYNGKDVPDYDNIFFLIDGGSGGGGNLIPDFFMEDWKDKAGKTHKGLLDKEYSADYIKQYPTAVNKIKVVTPSGYKSQMYEALIKMVESDLIIFPEHYDNHGYLVFTNEDTLKVNSVKQELYANGFTDEEVEEKLSEMNLVQQETYKLSLDEENALSQIDAMKEEIVNICRVKRDGGKDAFKLPAHKDADTGASEATMHDDRAYTLAMTGWYLNELRMQSIRTENKPKIDPKSAFKIRAPKKVSRF